MEEKIYELLLKMNKQLENIDNKLESMDKKVEAIFDQTADLTEFKTEVKTSLEIINNKLENVDEVKDVTVMNAFDIQLLKKRKS